MVNICLKKEVARQERELKVESLKWKGKRAKIKGKRKK